MRKIIHIAFLVLVFISCKKKEIGPQLIDDAQFSYSEKSVIIGCEGNFGWGNASISVYNSNKKTISNSAFKAVNGFGMGDVLQSISEINDKLYFVMNNSGKIIVTNKSTLHYEAEITGFTSPRYIQQVSATKAYVSDLYANKIWIFDLTTNKIVGEIVVDGWTEKMTLIGEKVYVCLLSSNKVLVINTNTDGIEQEIVVGKNPNSLVVDVNNHLWVLSSGGFNEELARLDKINPIDNSILKTHTFSELSMSPSSLLIDETGEQFYFMNNGIYSMTIYDIEIPTIALVEEDNCLFYGLGLDKETNEIYVSDAIDYVQPGKVFRYSKEGVLLDEFSVGIIPQHFQFVNQ
ncbi:MAG: YncE family protein [Bacteroidia bacterium]